MNKNYAYVSVISTDDYFLGLCALYDSLMSTKPIFPFYALLGKNISQKTENQLKTLKINVLRNEKNIFELPETVIKQNADYQVDRWNNTFEKLSVFELTQFEKIVFLDSDMMILDNIDHLFDFPNMSATNAGQLFPNNESWTELNSGIFVIEPKIGYIADFMNVMPDVMKSKKYFGDQDILQFYFKEWKNTPALNFGEQYNILVNYLSYYIDNLDFKINNSNRNKNIFVVHFIGYPKPWQYSDTLPLRIYRAAKFYFYKIISTNQAELIKLKYKKIIRKYKH